MSMLATIQQQLRPRLMHGLLIVGLCIGYAGVFLLLYPLVKGGIAPLGILPVLLAGWLLGRYAGLITGVVMNVMLVALFWSVQAEFSLSLLVFQALPSNIVVPCGGYLIGVLRELLDRTKCQARDLTYEREQLSREIVARKAIETELVDAKDAAEAASRAKSTFLANMSHELRTPLSAIIGYSELLQIQAEQQGNTECIADIAKIQSASQHLLNLINNVLDISKIEAGRMRVEPTRFALPRLIGEVVAAIEPAIDRNRNHLSVRLDPQLDLVYADETKLRQVLFNLLGNAAKFTEDGEVTLEVQPQLSGGTAWLTLGITDTGVGIDPEHLPQLFEEYAQAHAAATRRFGGTGLGLTISQRLCGLMGGEIRATSQLGRGSTFTIWLPLVSAER
ncbi:MAG: hypothetical protein IPP13_24325 [Kouleothrix sp.]|jgi:signal transduction histidine kinase|nr:hypothetical protein [Kouleothrix sp.]